MDEPQVEILTNLTALESIEPEWEALWKSCVGATPFQSPGWLIPWWRHLGEGELRAISFRNRHTGVLDGFFPLYVFREPTDGTRKLYPVGIATTDYHDALVRPGSESLTARTLMNAISELSGEWDEVFIPQLSCESVLYSLLDDDRRPGFRLSPGVACPVVDLPPSTDEYFRSLRPGASQSLRTARHRAVRAGSVEFSSYDGDGSAELFEALVRLNSERVRSTGGRGVFTDDRMVASHGETVRRFLGYGILRLHALLIDGRTAAVLYGFVDAYRSVFFYYLGGFDQAFSDLSPGSLLMEFALVSHLESGGKRFDFLRGGEAYKYRWGALDRPTFDLRSDEGERYDRL